MTMINKIFKISVLILLLLTIFAACDSAAQTADDTAAVSEVSTEDMPTPSANAQSTPSISTEPTDAATAQPGGDFVFPFSSIELLDADAQLVFTGECIAAEPKFQNDMLYTLSQIKVSQVFKGDISGGDILLFCEYGGQVTNGEYNKGCHLPPIPEKGQATVNDLITVGIDGYYPFQKGEKAVIFAADISGFLEDVDEPLYGIVGGYYGKLLLRDDGSYARPPSETDKDIYIDSFVVTLDELTLYY